MNLSHSHSRPGQLAASGPTTYPDILVQTYGADEVWPLVDIAAGTNVPATVNSNRDGTLGGSWSLQNAAGPVPGSLAPLGDGTTTYADIYSGNGSDGLADIFNGSTGSLIIWAKVSGAGVWTDGVDRWAIRLYSDANNAIQILKGAGNNVLAWRHEGSNVNRVLNFSPISATVWMCIGFSWNVATDEGLCYVNGLPFGAVSSPLTAWDNVLTGVATQIGAGNQVATGVWPGWLAYCAVKFGSVWSPTDFTNIYNAAATATP